MQGDREICLALGMDDYFSKPIHNSELVRVLRECLYNSQSLLQELYTSFAQKKFEVMLLTVHTLKSSSSVIGAEDLATQCRELETNLRNQIYDDLDIKINRITDEYANVKSELEHDKYHETLQIDAYLLMSTLPSNYVMTTDENIDRNKHPSLTISQKANIFETSPSQAPLILIVDDDSFMRKILVRYLERENYRVVEAIDGMEALKIYQECAPDIILLDAMMPVLDGFACCSQLQKLPNGDRTPVLIITALEDRESVDRAYEVGASDYVTKPIHWAVLRQRVRRLLDQANLHQQLESANQQLAIVVQELRRLVSIDGLTQVANRRCLDEYLEQECKRSQREKIPLSLVLCDIDFFKNYNDNYGHQEGDRCLQEIAQAISKSTNRPADLLARYGGEEFAIILPNTDGEGALNVAIRATEIVRSLQLPHAYSIVANHVTISCGVATLEPSQGFEVIHLLKSADRALYLAKAEGRNCVRQNAYNAM